MESGTVVQNRTSDPNRRPQPTGVSQHSPESKRSLEPLSRKETQAQSAVKNRIAVSNSSPNQNRSVATQSRTSLETLSRKETQVQSAVKNRIVVSNNSPKPESQSRYTESYKQKQLLSFFALEQ